MTIDKKIKKTIEYNQKLQKNLENGVSLWLLIPIAIFFLGFILIKVKLFIFLFIIFSIIFMADAFLRNSYTKTLSKKVESNIKELKKEVGIEELSKDVFNSLSYEYKTKIANLKSGNFKEEEFEDYIDFINVINEEKNSKVEETKEVVANQVNDLEKEILNFKEKISNALFSIFKKKEEPQKQSKDKKKKNFFVKKI